MPFAAHPVSTRGGNGAMLVGRTPGDEAAWIRVDGARRVERNERRDQGRAVGNEDVPADRAVEARDLLDRAEVEPRLELVAADRTRQQHAVDSRVVELAEGRLGNLLMAVRFVGDGGPNGAERPGAGALSRFLGGGLRRGG